MTVMMGVRVMRVALGSSTTGTGSGSLTGSCWAFTPPPFSRFSRANV